MNKTTRVIFLYIKVIQTGQKGHRPVKTQRWGAGMVICLEQGAELHIAQLMPLPLTVSLLQ